MEPSIINLFFIKMFVITYNLKVSQNFFLPGNLISPSFSLIINLLNTIGISEKTLRHITVAFRYKQKLLQDPYM